MTCNHAVGVSLLLFILIAASDLKAGELTITRVFGPEVPTGPYKHPACLTEFENGDLYLVYYGGARRIRDRNGGVRLSTQKGRDPVVGAQTYRARPVAFGRQRRHLERARRCCLAFLCRPIWGDMVDVRDSVQALAR